MGRRTTISCYLLVSVQLNYTIRVPACGAAAVATISKQPLRHHAFLFQPANGREDRCKARRGTDTGEHLWDRIPRALFGELKVPSREPTLYR